MGGILSVAHALHKETQEEPKILVPNAFEVLVGGSIDLLIRTDVAMGPYCALGGIRIPNLLIRSQMLYPIELRARAKFAMNGSSL